jgi:hypothetical protein
MYLTLDVIANASIIIFAFVADINPYKNHCDKAKIRC